MSLLCIRSSVPIKRVAAALVDNGAAGRFVRQQQQRLVHRSTTRHAQPASAGSRIVEQNVVTSPHVDFDPHGMNMVHRVFENASRWPDKTAIVSFLLFE